MSRPNKPSKRRRVDVMVSGVLGWDGMGWCTEGVVFLCGDTISHIFGFRLHYQRVGRFPLFRWGQGLGIFYIAVPVEATNPAYFQLVLAFITLF